MALLRIYLVLWCHLLVSTHHIPSSSACSCKVSDSGNFPCNWKKEEYSLSARFMWKLLVPLSSRIMHRWMKSSNLVHLVRTWPFKPNPSPRSHLCTPVLLPVMTTASTTGLLHFSPSCCMLEKFFLSLVGSRYPHISPSHSSRLLSFWHGRRGTSFRIIFIYHITLGLKMFPWINSSVNILFLIQK